MLDTVTQKVNFANGLVVDYHDRYVVDNTFGYVENHLFIAVFLLLTVSCRLVYWEISEKNCLDKLSQIYRGTVQVRKLKKNQSNVGIDVGDIVLLQDEKDNRFAGFHITGISSACNVIVYSTQVS